MTSQSTQLGQMLTACHPHSKWGQIWPLLLMHIVNRRHMGTCAPPPVLTCLLYSEHLHGSALLVIIDAVGMMRAPRLISGLLAQPTWLDQLHSPSL